LVKYQPRFLLEIIRSMIGDFLAWAVVVIAMCAIVFSYIYAFTDVEILGALIMTAIVIAVFFVIGLLGS